ncbi:MAG: hypothetical protein RLZZ08_1820 [Pseudomonadota bacterium]
MQTPITLFALLAIAAPTAAAAQETAPPLDLSGAFTVDAVSVVRGGTDSRLRVLTNLDLMAAADLERIAGWQGTRAYVHVLDNRGARPNDAAGTLQGVDNIEVANAGTRLFEAWVERDFGGAAVLAGLYDVNSEFYTNEAAGLLVAPPFGIGSEFAATGPKGPSIFPSTTLAVRLRVPVAQGRGQVQIAAVNAKASTLGDGGGIDTSFNEGLLLVAQAGTTQGPVRASLGGWAYTQERDDMLSGAASKRAPWGVYGLLEAAIAPALTAFVRAGISEGHTSPFSGGFQAGALLSPALPGRPDSAFSAGINHAWTTDCQRAAMLLDGTPPATFEQAIAATYADRLLPMLGAQVDAQWIRHPGGNAAARDALVTTLRLTIDF